MTGVPLAASVAKERRAQADAAKRKQQEEAWLRRRQEHEVSDMQNCRHRKYAGHLGKCAVFQCLVYQPRIHLAGVHINGKQA